MKRLRYPVWLVALAAVSGVMPAAREATAAEEAQRFLDGLRQRGYFEMALAYLDQAANDPIVAGDFKRKIDYEAGVTLIGLSQVERAGAVREKRLDEAQSRLNRFIQQQRSHPLASGAIIQLAKVLVERGGIYIAQAESDKTPEEERTAARRRGRELLIEAKEAFEKAEAHFLREHKEFPDVIRPTDSALLEKRDQVRKDLLTARLALAAVLREIANTFEPGTKEYKERMTAAADKYSDFAKKYDSYLAGMYAQLFAGECYRDMGDSKKAFGEFESLLTIEEDAPSFRLLKSKAAVAALETTLRPDVKKYPQALKLLDVWEAKARPDEQVSPEGLAIQYLGAEAAFNQAKTAEPSEARELLARAKKLYTTVGKHQGEYQRAAKQALTREEYLGKDGQRPEPMTFADARDRGREYLDKMQQAGLAADEKAEAQAHALNYYKLALGLKTDETTSDELNAIRYYMAYLYYVLGRPYEAAVVGEFLARRYPGGPGARQGAKIAMASYAQLMNQAKVARKKALKANDQAALQAAKGNEEFANDRMVEIARYIAQRWEGQGDAMEAQMMIVRDAIVDGDLQRAEAELDKFPAEAPKRGEAELLLGQAYWSQYLTASQQPEETRPPQPELDAMVAKSQKRLESGLTRMRKAVEAGEQIDRTLAASVLSLAQLHVAIGESEEAVTWLEDPQIGPMALIEKQHPVLQEKSLQEAAYKTALQAYVAIQQLEKAEATMKKLEETANQAEVTRIYIKLGKELEEMLARFREQNKATELAAVSRGFELFLTQISNRQQGNTFGSLHWVAETFYGMGAGFDPGEGTLPTRAKGYYEKAADTYQKILDQCGGGQIDCPPNADLSLKIRLASTQRRLGKHKEALELLVGILTSRASVVDAQVEAAKVYESWGESEPDYYLVAIAGSSKHKNVWGWGGIARRLAGNKKYEDRFHDARYHLALCRFRHAQSKSGSEKKEVLKQALNDVLIIEKLYPTMGGPQHREKYDRLLRNIQELQGVEPTGLGPAPQ